MEELRPQNDQRRLAAVKASAWNATPFVIKACRLKALIRKAFLFPRRFLNQPRLMQIKSRLDRLSTTVTGVLCVMNDLDQIGTGSKRLASED